jgi:hypothetical protein
MKNSETLQEQIDNLQDLARDKQYEINNFEIDESTKEEQHDDMLNDCYEGIFGLTPSRILKECDPIMYNEELSNYVDSLDVSDEEEYIELQSELDEIENEIAELQDELDGLQEEE